MHLSTDQQIIGINRAAFEDPSETSCAILCNKDHRYNQHRNATYNYCNTPHSAQNGLTVLNRHSGGRIQAQASCE